MEIIQVKVDINGGAAALSQIEKIEKAVISLKKQAAGLDVDVDTAGIGAAEKAFGKMAGSAGKAEKATFSLGNTMMNALGSRVINAAINAVTNSLEDALDTMKKVDDELVTVRKVTGATASELEALEKRAYKTASAYGEAADEYLNSVAAFTRAGYGDQAADLAELATKTKLVGDTNAQTAQQFLLSVDAAYKYKGSVEELQKVLDGANEIDNRYATSIEKIAEGLGKVAPIASQAHVGVDELSAAIGTITAVTQRSGTEASTALRALFLNILGDTKTEIDEGVTWTTGEIAGLRDVIKLYAKDAYDAAQATGSVINPMEAIAGLSKSMKDGLLTEQKLMSMVSDIGGKLRTSQLLALIQNWDMYESMLSDFGNAAGSADKEVENALDSWTRKTNILKNTWAELVSKTIQTDWIKGIIDDVTTLVGSFDNLGDMIVNVGGILGGLKLAKSGLNLSGGLSGLLGGLAGSGAGAGAALSGALPWVGVAVAAFATINTAIKVYKENLREAAAESLDAAQKSATQADNILGLYTAYKTAKSGTDEFTTAQGDLQNALYESNEYAKTLKSSLDSLALVQIYKAGEDAAQARKDMEKTLKKDYRNDAKRNAPLLGDYAKTLSREFESPLLQANVLNALRAGLDYSENGDFFSLREGAEGLEDYYETLLKIQEIFVAFDAANPDSGILSSAFYEGITSQIDRMKDSMESYAALVDTEMQAIATKEVATYLSKNDIANQADFDAYIQSIKESTEYSEAQREVIYDLLADKFPAYAEAAGIATDANDELAESSESAGDSAEEASNRVAAVQGALDEMAKTLSVSKTAFEDFNENGRLSYDTLSEIIDAFSSLDGLDDYISRLTDANLTGDELNRVLSEMTQQYVQNQAAANGLTQADADLVAAVLEAAGVENAHEVALTLLTKAFDNDKDAALRAKAAHEAISKAGLDLSPVRVELFETIEAWNAYYDAKIRALGAAGLGLSSAQQASATQANLYDTGNWDAAASLQTQVGKKSGTKSYAYLYKMYNPGGSGGSSGSGGSGGGGGSSSEKEEDVWADRKSALDDLIKAREKVIEIDQREGVSTDELIARYREMQGQVHDLAEEYRAANDVEDDDYTYALKDSYWDLQDKIDKLKEQRQQEALQRYEDEEALLESELDILKAQDASVEDRAAKMREIAASIKKQIDYLKSIGGDQTEINKLTADWLNMLNDATELLEKAAREKMQALIDAANEMLDALREAQTGALDEQLDRLQSARDTQKQILDIQEKQLAVEKAKIALENAKRERTVRYFNAETNQWEWMADAGKVKDAEESLQDAERNLAEAYADQAYNSAVKQIKTQQNSVKKAYNSFEKSWGIATQSVLDGSMSLEEAFAYMVSAVKQIALDTGIDMSEVLAQMARKIGIDPTTGKAGNATATIAATGEDIPIYINEKGQTETKGLVAGDIVHTGAGDYEVTGGSSVSTGSTGYTSKQLFDGGGILRGMGGIKATAQDEMILDPALTRAMLAPSADRTFRQRASLLGYLFGAGGQYGAAPGAGTTNNEAVSHNEKIYNFGSISLSEPQAKSMSVYQLARLAGSLHVYANS